MFKNLTSYAEDTLKEILSHKNINGYYDTDYWQKKFETFSADQDELCRSCFKELSDHDLVKTRWADNCPYHISVTSKGLSYFGEKGKEAMPYSIESLLNTAQDILVTEFKRPGDGIIAPNYISGPKYNKWLNDLRIKQSMLPDSCPLKEELAKPDYYKNNSVSTVKKIVGLLESLKEWEENAGMTAAPETKVRKQYDVFLSHANSDKSDYVDALFTTLRKLGVNIFYDTDVLSWGDNWKKVILDGTATSEFAIIVISENFFGREWTEKELSEFLKRQNESGQKIVLPLLHNISVKELTEKYPLLGDIQCIDTTRYSKEEITILFAKELIKRLHE